MAGLYLIDRAGAGMHILEYTGQVSAERRVREYD